MMPILGKGDDDVKDDVKSGTKAKARHGRVVTGGAGVNGLSICEHILVPKERAPFGQHQESRPLAGSDILSMRREFVSYSQPIRFVRLDSVVVTKRSAASGDENVVNTVGVTLK